MDFQIFQAISLTFRLALYTSLLLLVLATPLAWWLARGNSSIRTIVEALVALPLVLPPTVIGFYLLITLGPQGPFAGLLVWLGQQSLNFSFTGLLIASMVYSLPFVVQPLRQGFTAIPRQQLLQAGSLGAGALDQFFSIALPQAKSFYLMAAVLGFTHTVGEFGVVLMVGGNIPGETQVLSIALYEMVEAMQYQQAHYLAGGLLLFSFIALFFLYRRPAPYFAPQNDPTLGRLL